MTSPELFEARRLAARVETAVRRCLPEELAYEEIGKHGWRLLLRRWQSWEQFYRYFHSAYGKSSPTIVFAQLRDYFEAGLSENEGRQTLAAQQLQC